VTRKKQKVTGGANYKIEGGATLKNIEIKPGPTYKR